jgi:hypothetical protein
MAKQSHVEEEASMELYFYAHFGITRIRRLCGFDFASVESETKITFFSFCRRVIYHVEFFFVVGATTYLLLFKSYNH